MERYVVILFKDIISSKLYEFKKGLATVLTHFKAYLINTLKLCVSVYTKLLAGFKCL